MCARPKTVFVTSTDLGTVVVGSQFTRQILVRFGFKPHVFFMGALTPTSDISISESGTITGIKSEVGKESFEVRVSDVVNGEPTLPIAQVFSVTGIAPRLAPNLALQFVSGPGLPVAVANEPYSFTLQANGGNPPYTFEFASDSDFQKLPVGLSLNPETGELSGKPVVPTTETANFTIIVRDSLASTSIRQFTMDVLPGTISSDFVATSGNFKLNFGRPNSDSLKLTIVLNKTDLARNGIRETSDLLGQPFEMTFGGVPIPPALFDTDTGEAAEPGVFNKNGEIRFPDVLAGVVQAKGEAVEYQIKLNAKTGVLNVNAKNFPMIKTLGANFNSFRDIIPATVKIGTSVAGADAPAAGEEPVSPIAFDKTDVIKFDYKRRGAIGRGSARLNDRTAPAGLFLITKVQGVERQITVVDPVDPTKFTNPDRLFLKISGFMKQVGGKPIQFGTSDQVSILLGNSCLGDFPASSLKRIGDRLELRNDDENAAGLFNFVIDNKKGTVYMDTHGIDPRAIFGQDILVSDDALVMPITLTISSPTNPAASSPVFDGQSSVTLFRKGNTLKNK